MRNLAWPQRVFKSLRATAPWHASCTLSVRIGNVAADPKEGTTMTKLTTKLMIAAAALVVAAGAASAQQLRADIPFAFRAGNKVMTAGNYRVWVNSASGVPVFRISNEHSRGSVILLSEGGVAPQKAWTTDGNARLVFACGSGRCALAQLWTGENGSWAYTFRRPKLGKDDDTQLTAITMRRDSGE